MPDHGLQLAVLVHDLSATGVVRNAIRLAGHMADRGQKTELWVVRDEGAFRAQVSPQVAIRRIGREQRPLSRRLETLRAVKSLARLISEQRPAVLLSAGNHFHLAGGLAYRAAGRPSATRFMGRASNATPRLGVPLISRLAQAIDAFKYREMHMVIAVSRELASDLQERLRLAPQRITVIPNGVDLERIGRLASEPLADPWFEEGAPPVIVSAGRLSRQKNFPLLIDAFAHVRQSRTVRLVIIGEGSVKAKARLMAQARGLGVVQDMRLQGFEANPMRFFARAGLFVLSSRWEGASNVLLEAMACGCPVVAVDCPTGVREQLDEGRIGTIVPQGDPEALASAMAGRLDQERDSRGLKRYVAGFAEETMLAGYERVLGGGKPDVDDACQAVL